ncbi:unnamed protein product [Phytophthora fragariaefolia]|uniref:Unnamed protein product n=1 Tax=Phytophthora fragariaefolia TaxID=1490495 RepID=A0A9W6U649_9STRA|nr:unnamed protein product [Phytophthora fragariaefolia]
MWTGKRIVREGDDGKMGNGLPLHFSLWPQRCSGWSTRVLEQSDSQIPFISHSPSFYKEPEAVAITVVLLSTCAAALAAATVDKRSCRRAPSTVSTFSTTTFEEAMAAADTDWFHKKLRCDRTSFLRLYQEVHAAYTRKPVANSECPLVKRFALTMMYFAQGGTMDSAASVLGISRPSALVYINDCIEVLSPMAAKYCTWICPEQVK